MDGAAGFGFPGRIGLPDAACVLLPAEECEIIIGIATGIPLNELQKNKIIVTACPHKDRAILAMAYLRTKGFRSKYLVDGLVGLSEYLRGDKARNFVESMDSH